MQTQSSFWAWVPMTVLAYIAILGLGKTASAEEIFLHSPHYGTEYRNTDAKTLPGVPATEVHTANGFTFNIWYRDIINANGLGFNGANGNAARARVRDALTYIASVLNTTGQLDIVFEHSDPNLYPPGFLASAGTFFANTPGFQMGSTMFRIIDGTKQFANNEEIQGKVLFNQPWNFTPNAPGQNQLDFLSVMIHEFVHGLGIVSLSDASGASMISPGIYSIYDLLLRHPPTLNIELFDAVSGFTGTPGDLNDDQLIFFGGTAFLSYNREVNIPVHSPAAFLQGTSLSHWSTARLQGGAAVMEPFRLFGQATRELRPFEIGALRDIGYATVIAPIEEVVGEGEGEGEPGGEGEGEPGGEGEGEVLCILQCISTTPDTDSDGISDACEQCIGTSVTNPDTDGDGLPDGFEYDNGFDPVQTNDADGDADLDGRTNFEEFLFGSDPLDIDDPQIVRFIDPNIGLDAPLAGTSANPWQSVTYALSQIDGPATLKLASGTYNENITMESNISLIGSACDVASKGPCASIEGTVTGASGAELKNLILTQATAGAVLLNMSSVMNVQNVQFVGGVGQDARGILVTGAAPEDSVIEDCVFDSLDIGIDISGAIPKIRKNTFRNHNTAYIVIRSGALVKSFGKAGSLGDSTDSSTGFNVFEAPITDIAVINETSTTVSMENNNWGTSNAQSIDDRIDGPADFEPFLASGSAILASSIYCTVWQNDNQKRVLNATVALAPGGVKSVTDNTNGVYVFAALPAGSYTVTASAPGFTVVSQNVNVAAGNQASIILPVALDNNGGEGENEGEEEGEGEGEEDCRGCFGGKNGKGKAASIFDQPADMLLFLTVLGVLGLVRRRHGITVK